MIRRSGYQTTLMMFGILLGGIGVSRRCACVSPAPASRRPRRSASARPRRRRRDDAENAGVLADVPDDDHDVDRRPDGDLAIRAVRARFRHRRVAICGMAALPFALTLDRITNGLTRPFFGWVSDRIGRENTMLIAFRAGGGRDAAAARARHRLLFALMSGVVFFGWGEIFSLFPSTLTDTFGAQDATTKYGFLYMAQGIGSVLGGPVAAALHDATGSWMRVFMPHAAWTC